MSADDDKKNEKKERVIHTRISESLEQELKDRAASLGVSVSNLVRNVLSNTVDLVDEIVADTANVARSVGSQRTRGGGSGSAPVASGGDVVAWQTAVLNLNAVCRNCNAILPKGTDAAVGIGGGAGPQSILCLACLEELRRDDPSNTNDSDSDSDSDSGA